VLATLTLGPVVLYKSGADLALCLQSVWLGSADCADFSEIPVIQITWGPAPIAFNYWQSQCCSV